MGIRIFISKCKVNTTMYSKLAISACLLAVAAAVPAGPQAPGYAPADPILPPVYNYEYGVNDPNYGPVFSQKESRDNYDTAGEYRVNLPDGRVQIVSYSAGPDGYVADVKYEGEATYPDHVPAPHPAPVHKPAPVVHKPAPVYHPAPVVHKPAPVYHPAPAPVYHPAPIVHHAPIHHAAPFHHAPVYHPAPAPYKPRTKYTFKTVEPEAPAAKEAEAAPAEAAPAEEAAEE